MDESIQKQIEAALPPAEEQWALWCHDGWCELCLSDKHKSAAEVNAIHPPACWVGKGEPRRVFVLPPR